MISQALKFCLWSGWKNGFRLGELSDWKSDFPLSALPEQDWKSVFRLGALLVRKSDFPLSEPQAYSLNGPGPEF